MSAKSQSRLQGKASIKSILERLGACSEAVEWSSAYGSNYQKAWNECERGDHLLWLAGRTIGKAGSARHRKVVLAACACARLALPHVTAGELRPLAAIETAEKWARREDGVTIDDVRKARAAAYAAYAAATSATSDVAAYAADAASDAAADAASDAADAAAYAADAAAYAADAASDAAAYAAYAAARTATWKKCADLVREHIPRPPMPQKQKAK